MEDLLQLYEAPYDPKRPARYDYEYERRGTRNLFVFFEPQRGWRHIQVTQRRTKADFAGCMRELVDEWYPQAECIRLVLDNLNTHFAGSLVETWGKPEAERLLAKLEFHYTPKHASWLNQVESELGVLAKQCLNRRIGDEESLKSELLVWEAERNRRGQKGNWEFTKAVARRKFARFYPSLSNG